MANGSSNSKKKQAAGVKRLPLIAGGIIITAAVLFGLSYLVELMTRSDNATVPLPESPAAPSGDDEQVFPRGSPADDDSYRSYFKSLLEKNDRQSAGPPSTSTSVHEESPRPEQPARRYDDIPLYRQDSREDDAHGDTVYKVQLGSFAGMQHAQWFSEKLAAKGYEPYIVEKKMPGKGTVYRVRIGKFTDMEEAKKLAATLEDEEDMTAFITSR
jgi:cell division septation protein DedD